MESLFICSPNIYPLGTVDRLANDKKDLQDHAARPKTLILHYPNRLYYLLNGIFGQVTRPEAILNGFINWFLKRIFQGFARCLLQEKGRYDEEVRL